MEEDIHTSSGHKEKISFRTSVNVNRCYGSVHSEPEKSQPFNSNTIDVVPSRLRSYIAVAVLCYVNLLNYMDRYTIAGEGSSSTHKSQ